MFLLGAIHEDAILNLAWVVVCVSALVWQLLRERGSRSGPTQRSRNVLAVFLAAVALFPCISASDDLVRLRDLDAGAIHPPAFQKSSGDNLPLALQLEDLDHAHAPSTLIFLLILSFLAMVSLEERAYTRVSLTNSSSRAPPSC